MRAWHRPISLLCILAGGVLVACSEVKIAYRFADTVIENQVIDRYLLLDDEGERLASERIDEYLGWHRSQMLPRYSAFLKSQVHSQQNGWVDREWVRRSSAEGKRLWDQTVERAIPSVAEVLSRHTSPHQIEHLRAQMAARDQELLEQMSRPEEEQIAERVEQIAESFERFTGDLTDAQVALIERHTRSMFSRSQVWWRTRALRQDAFLEHMRKRPDKAELERFLRVMLLEPHKLAEPGYRVYQEAFREQAEQMVFEVLASLDAEQRQLLIESLLAFAADFDDLAG